MSFSVVATTRHLIAPRHELSCSWRTWRAVLTGLRSRGGGVRESGAFLLGQRHGNGRARIEEFVLYDDLDPHVLDSGIIRFDGRHFGRLWDLCRRKGSTVVADVHTHPCGPEQSDSDQWHPMISQRGHVALIVPRFALGSCSAADVGVYRYQGGKRWQAVARQERRHFFYIGI
jgi:proteasome lid subunit RPN8/RPN11